MRQRHEALRINPLRPRVPGAALAVRGRRAQYDWYGPGEPRAASVVRPRRRRAPPAGSRSRPGARVSSVEEALGRAEELLARLNERREELERLAAADDVDGDAAVDVIAELAELARQIEAELTRARTLADANG